MESDRYCELCDRPSGNFTYCGECDSMIGRLKTFTPRDMQRGRDALRAHRNERNRLICAYTGVELSFHGGARDAEWDHVDPRNDPTSVAPAAAIVNRMKGDMTVVEFDAMIGALYDYRTAKSGPFNEEALPRDWQPKSTARLRARRARAWP